MEVQQDIVGRISAFSEKLSLLEKAHEIEERELERVSRNVEKRSATYKQLKSTNDRLSMKAVNEVEFQNEERVRRELIEEMMNSSYNDPLNFITPVTNVLKNFEGNS